MLYKSVNVPIIDPAHAIMISVLNPLSKTRQKLEHVLRPFPLFLDDYDNEEQCQLSLESIKS